MMHNVPRDNWDSSTNRVINRRAGRLGVAAALRTAPPPRGHPASRSGAHTVSPGRPPPRRSTGAQEESTQRQPAHHHLCVTWRRRRDSRSPPLSAHPHPRLLRAVRCGACIHVWHPPIHLPSPTPARQKPIRRNMRMATGPLPKLHALTHWLKVDVELRCLCARAGRGRWAAASPYARDLVPEEL